MNTNGLDEESYHGASYRALHARKYGDIPNDIQVVTKGPRRLVVQEEEKKSTESWFLL